MFASVFILLYIGHLLADYPLQTDHQAGCKADHGTAGWRANLTHASTHLATCALLLSVGVLVLDLHIATWPALASLAWIAGTHAVIDRRWPITRWMHFARQEKWAEHGGAAHVDQTAHITALGIAALIIAAV